MCAFVRGAGEAAAMPGDRFPAWGGGLCVHPMDMRFSIELKRERPSNGHMDFNWIEVVMSIQWTTACLSNALLRFNPLKKS